MEGTLGVIGCLGRLLDMEAKAIWDFSYGQKQAALWIGSCRWR